MASKMLLPPTGPAKVQGYRTGVSSSHECSMSWGAQRPPFVGSGAEQRFQICRARGCPARERQRHLPLLHKSAIFRNFPGGLLAKTPCFHCRAVWVQVLVQEFKIPQVVGLAKKTLLYFTLRTGGLLSSGNHRAVVAVRWYVSWPLNVSQHAGRIPSLRRRFPIISYFSQPRRGPGAPGSPRGFQL